MKDLNYQTIFERTFLLENLPKGINKADEHLQIYENFIEKTRLCTRKIRSPKTNDYTYILEQKFPVRADDLSVWNISRIFLNKAEYQAFQQFKAHEIRFNRYFYKYQSKQIEIDVYLGKEISGLVLGRILFDTFGEMQDFELPVFSILEVTQNKFFIKEILVGKTFADVQEELRVRRSHLKV